MKIQPLRSGSSVGSIPDCHLQGGVRVAGSSPVFYVER
jgi:hypothetical protein